MTDSQLTILLTYAPSIIGALITGYIAIRLRAVEAKTITVAQTVETVATATEQQTPKIEEALSGIKGVEKMVDGAASKASAEANGLRNEIRMLREQAAEGKERAALLAQAVAQVNETTVATEAGVNHLNGMDEPHDTVRQIEKNTEETAKNTARVQSTVDDVKSQVEELKKSDA